MMINNISKFSFSLFLSLFLMVDMAAAADVASKNQSGVNFVSAIAIAVVAASVLVIIFFTMMQNIIHCVPLFLDG